MKYKIIIISILVIFRLGTDYALHNILPYSIIKPLRLNRDIQRIRLGNKTRPEDFGLNYSVMNIKTRDGIWLKANYIRPNNQNRNITVIILHGIADTKESQTEKANFLAKRGIASLIPDLRAHGESGGNYCTYGYYEKYDIVDICKQLRLSDTNVIVGIWGTSLGGAIAIQAMGIDSSISFGIVESTFDELEKVVDKYANDLIFGLNLHSFRVWH